MAPRDDSVTFRVRFGVHRQPAKPLRIAHPEEVHGHLLCAASNAGRGLALFADAAVLDADHGGASVAHSMARLLSTWEQTLGVVLQVAPEAIRWLYTGETGRFYRVHSRSGGVPGAVALTPVMGGRAELQAWAPDLAPWLLATLQDAATVNRSSWAALALGGQLDPAGNGRTLKRRSGKQ